MAKQTFKRLEGNTASQFESAFHGLIVKIEDGADTVMVQRFRPNGEDTTYSKPVRKDLEFYEDEDTGEEHAGFKYWHEVYFIKDFMRDSYPQEVNAILAGERKPQMA
jgi:hypothetical protein